MRNRSVETVVGSAHNGCDEFPGMAAQRVVFAGCRRGIQIHAGLERGCMVAVQLHNPCNGAGPTNGGIVVTGNGAVCVIGRNGFNPSHTVQ